MDEAAEIIRRLDLRPLPHEGGYYRETYRSADLVPGATAVAAVFDPQARLQQPWHTEDKAVSTAIYYLLTPDTFSALHRLPTDEVFHHYLGGPVHMLQLLPDGRGQMVVLGSDLRAGERPQVIVPRGVWQGSFLGPGRAFALLGTTMAPGFDFSDYEAGDRAALCARYPDFAALIHQLTRSTPHA
jgi:predicted cupin superfamily sugar epimerase